MQPYRGEAFCRRSFYRGLIETHKKFSTKREREKRKVEGSLHVKFQAFFLVFAFVPFFLFCVLFSPKGGYRRIKHELERERPRERK